MNDDPLIAIVGPTGSGKTALSLELGERWDAEIVSCDSVAVYREFEIGVAKPGRQERARLPHHMIDVMSPEDEMTAGEYSRQARSVLAGITQRGRLPIIVGGTGLYLKSLIDGLAPAPPRAESLRRRLQQRTGARLHRLLRRLDTSAAERIHPNDAPKLVRAIEVCFAARKPMTSVFARGREGLTGFRILVVGLDPPRDRLYARIDDRCRKMFEQGLVEETRGLLEKYPQLLQRPNSPLNALGYRQAARHLRGELSLEDAIAAAAQAHRNYAKRQLTWFRRQHGDVRWINTFGDDPRAQQAATQMLAAFLG